MPLKQLKEKIIELIERFNTYKELRIGGNLIDKLADQLLELFSQREKEILEIIKQIPTMNGGQKNWKNYLLEKLKQLK